MQSEPEPPAPVAPPLDDQWHRLHPTSLVFGIGTLGKALLLPGLFILFSASQSDSSRWEFWAMLFFIPALGVQFLRYFTLRYRFAEDELIIKQGLLFRNERHIPLARLQNIDLVQNLLQRLLKVASVKLETAGGGEAEAELKVLSLDAVARMRTRVFANHPPSVAEPFAANDGSDGDGALRHVGSAVDNEGITVLRLSTPELIKLGVISMRALAAIAIGIGLMWEFDLWDRFKIDDWFDSQRDDGFAALRNWQVVVAALSVIPGLLGLSVLWTIVRLHGFTLVRRGDDLRLSCGLLTRLSATVPRKRIQLLSVRESILHRPFKRVSIRIETAGGKKDDSRSASISEKLIVPILPRDDLPRVLGELQPGLSFEGVQWHGLAPRAVRRMVMKSLIVAGIVSALATIVAWQLGLGVFVVLGSLWTYLAIRESRSMGFAQTETSLMFRSGVWNRKTSVARYDRLQTVGLVQSPFDRRHSMATLEVDTAGAGPAHHRIRVPYVDAALAAKKIGELSREAGRLGFQWG